MDIDRISINSAILQLLENPFDTEAADAIIQFGNTLQARNRFFTSESHSTKTSKSDVTGHTQQLGNVNVPIRHTETRDIFSGITFERIGHYKVWRVKKDLICFQYFWKASVATQGAFDVPPEYGILFNPSTLEYRDLVEEIKIPKFSFRSSTFGLRKWKSLRDGREFLIGIFQHTLVNK